MVRKRNRSDMLPITEKSSFQLVCPQLASFVLFYIRFTTGRLLHLNRKSCLWPFKTLKTVAAPHMACSQYKIFLFLLLTFCLIHSASFMMISHLKHGGLIWQGHCEMLLAWVIAIIIIVFNRLRGPEAVLHIVVMHLCIWIGYFSFHLIQKLFFTSWNVLALSSTHRLRMLSG